MKQLHLLVWALFIVLHANAQNKINAYEYWFDNDYADKVTTVVTPVKQFFLNADFATTGLANGIHTLNIRFKDNDQKWSTTLSQFFYKLPQQETSTHNLTTYEYWFDNDYDNAFTVSTPAQKQVSINELINVQSLNNGIHTLNIRFKDNAQLWSSTLSQFFYKMPVKATVNNVITNYRYWIDDDFANANYMSLSAPVKQYNLIDDLDLTGIPKGDHSLHFQFKDSLGLWSSVTTDNIFKNALPVSNFSYTADADCDSTTISFTDLSIDGDVYFWDLGDGNSSTIANPMHTYYTPDTYQVSLTITDTLSGIDSTYTIPIIINSLHTSAAITEFACDSYTAPDGQVYTNSGIKTAVIENAAGCDSTITIDLTVQIVDASVSQNGATLTANATEASYQWLDCNNGYSEINDEINQSFTAVQNGNYAVEITQNNCVSISDCIEVTVVGILENTFNQDVIVYPNPTNGLIKVDLGEVENQFTVKIHSINGDLIREASYKNTDTFEMYLNAQSGVYVLTIKSDIKSATIKIIKH